MIKSKQKLEKYLTDQIYKMSDDKIEYIELLLLENNNVPVSVSSDFLTFKKDISEANELILFYLLNFINKDKVNEYYSDAEISLYSNEKYIIEEKNKTLAYPMCQVADDQWIGTINSSELMKLRDAQRISYNANTQRAMKHIVRNGNDIYKPSLNNTAVGSIAKAYQDGIYIPTTITLNVPDDSECIPTYRSGILYLEDLESFDILDGYHRYIALSRCHDANKDFNYQMELRIVSFPEAKAKQFVYQEDQKTKMNIRASKSMNQYDIGNIIVNRINIGNTLLNGEVNNNGGIINTGDLSFTINRFLVNNNLSKREAMDLADELGKYYESIIKNDAHFIDGVSLKVWEIIAFTYFYSKHISPEKAIEIHSRMIQTLPSDKLNLINITHSGFRRAGLNILKSIVELEEGGEIYV